MYEWTVAAVYAALCAGALAAYRRTGQRMDNAGHRVAYTTPTTTTALPAGDARGSGMPAGSGQGPTDFGPTDDGGPCPPPGDRPHRSVFTVHALEGARLDLPAAATAACVGFTLHANRRGAASLTARDGR